MQDPSTSADRGRMLVPALLIAAVAALALWAVVTLGSTDPASAAGTTAPAVQTQPVQDEAAPPQRDGHDCPEHDGEGSGSGGGGGASQAPQDEAPDASATPDV